MDISGAWLPELEMEDPHHFMNQYQRPYPCSDSVESFSSESFKGHLNRVKRNQSVEAATINTDLGKQESYKANTTSSFAPICGSSSNTFTISFGDVTSSTEINLNQLYEGYKLSYHDELKPKEEMTLNELIGSIELSKRVSSTRRNRRQAQEHVLAERKRREKLTQRFVSLSALLPEIKKMDKATVLEDATKYIKNLQNRVKELEETSIADKNFIHESTTSMRRSKFHGRHEDDASSFDETKSLPCNTAFDPGTKVRISGSNVLVRIYCRRNSSLALNTLVELMGKLQFTIMCSSDLPISDTAAVITIIAQMGEDFTMTAIDLVKCLRSSLLNFL